MAVVSDMLLLVLQMALHFLSAVLGLFICIPVGITSSQFGNRCLLYASIDNLSMTPKSNCEFVLFESVVLCVMYGVAAGALHTYQFICMKRGEELLLAGVLPLVAAGMNTLCTLFTLIAACMVTVWFQHWCNSLTAGYDPSHVKLKHTCHLLFDVTSSGWDQIGINGSTFHTNLQMAEVCAWLCWLIVLCLALISGFSLIHKGSLRGFLPGRSAGDSNKPRTQEMEYPRSEITTHSKY